MTLFRAVFPVVLFAAFSAALLAFGAARAETVDDDFDFESFSFEEEETAAFDDRPLEEEVVLPPWFKMSFLELSEDLRDAREAGKDGLIVYFGQKYCPYCKALMEVNFGKRDIAEYTQAHFDVIAIDIDGDRSVTDMQERVSSEKAFAEREGLTFTPSLLFFDAETGGEALRLRGYYPPYRFRAALEYVADDHYRHESFRDYLARAGISGPADGELAGEPFFGTPPYFLNRTRIHGERPLAVFFEQPDCHACDVLHEGPLGNMIIRGQLEMLDTVQLDMWRDTPVVTPSGKKTTSGDWARDLGLFYAPTIIFFDRRGEEILRVDSVVHFYRLRNVLDYILSGVYRGGVSFQDWRRGPLPGGRRRGH